MTDLLFYGFLYGGIIAAVCAAIWQDGQRGVPDFDEWYPATEPNEDDRYEYAREQAMEDAR